MQRTSEPPIVINGVSYGSREEIPEHLRELWDEFERHRARQATSWEREGFGVTPPPIHVGRTPPPPRDTEWEARARLQRLRTAAVLAYLVCGMGLGLYGMMYRDPPLVFPVYNAWTLITFILVFGPIVPFAVKHFGKFSTDKPIRETSGLLAVGLLFAHAAGFHGVPKVLHGFENQSGEVLVTVSGKYPSSKALRCTHVELKEFRFLNDSLCVDASFYKAVKVGDRLLLTGRKSRYAFAPEQLKYLGQT